MSTANVNAVTPLEDELTEALATSTGLRPDLARSFVQPLIQHLQTQYGGGRLYIPSPGRFYDVAEIAAYLEVSRDVNATCAKFGMSRRTLYRLVDDYRTAPELPLAG